MLLRSLTALAALLLTVTLFGACDGQGEGDVCDPRLGTIGNSDCRNGYYCKTMTGSQMTGARCCPGDPALVTTTACGLNQGGGTGDASTAAPVEAGADSDATSVEASSDAPSADALGVDAPSTDAPADAPPADAPTADAPSGE